MMEEESLGWVSSAEEIHLIRKAAENFAPAGLQRHLLRRLAEAPPPTAAIANASMASGHEPTVWSTFSNAVQARLEARAFGDPAHDWRKDFEWQVMHQMKTIQARQDTRSQPSTPEPKCTGQNFQVIIHQEENGKRASGTRRHVLEAAASLVLRADLEDGEEETPSLEPRTARAQESLVDESARAISEGGGRGESEQRVAARPARKEPSRVTTGRTKRPGKRQGSRNDASRLQNGTRSALVPNERQPLGKSQVGAATLAWLGIATEKLASDYLRVCSEIVDLNRSKSAEEQLEALIRAARPQFSPTRLVAVADQILCLQGTIPEDVSRHAQAVRWHVPTVWSSFTGAVRATLMARVGGQQAGNGWTTSVEWQALKQLYDEGKERGALNPSAAVQMEGSYAIEDGPVQVKPGATIVSPSSAKATAEKLTQKDADFPPPLLGSTELADAVNRFAATASELLLLERFAAIQSAETRLLGDGGGSAAGAAYSQVNLLVEAAQAAEISNEEEAMEAERRRAEASRTGDIFQDSVEGNESWRPLTNLKVRNVQLTSGQIVLTLSALNSSRALLGETGLATTDIILIRPARSTSVDEPRRAAGKRRTTTAPGRSSRASSVNSKRKSIAELRQIARREEAALEAGGGLAEDAGLRGVVFRQSKYSIGIVLEDESSVGGTFQLSNTEDANEAPKNGSDHANNARLLALGRSLLGLQVRVDRIGSDATHSRNMWALEQLRHVARRACEGIMLPPWPVVHAVFCPWDEVATSPSSLPSLPSPRPPPFSISSTLDKTLDDTQLEAVALALDTSRALVAVQGPPGTGKTGVVVEVARQAVARGERLLLCAPSNLAVDGLVLRLVAADASLRLVRVGNPERLDATALELTPAALAKAAEANLRAEVDRLTALLASERKRGGNSKKIQRAQQRLRQAQLMLKKTIARGEAGAIAGAQIVLCTATASSEPAIVSLPPFDLSILDEAGQATAPNAWLPLLRARRAVLVGDPMQLPPTLLSPEAARRGLATSLMESFMATAPDACQLLETQYRMHEVICAWASQAMYKGSLRAAPGVSQHTLADLPTAESNELTRAPILLLDTPAPSGRAGNEMRRVDGAVTNAAEAEAAVDHVRALAAAGVPVACIAVLSPYAAQVELIRVALSAANLEAVETATVDGYQGRESDAIVLSLVRSNPRGSVGFLGDERRLNVAITRARRHLAIVCDASTLKRKPFLRQLLEYIAVRGLWKKKMPFSSRPSENPTTP